MCLKYEAIRKLKTKETKERNKMKNEVTNLKKDSRRKLLRSYLISTVACATVAVFMVPVLATEGTSDAETAINNMSNIIFGIIRAIGVILSGWGLVQVGMSFQSHDPSQRSQGFLCLAGGLIIVFAKSILQSIAPGAFPTT
jgi:hypothetical protein